MERIEARRIATLGAPRLTLLTAIDDTNLVSRAPSPHDHTTGRTQRNRMSVAYPNAFILPTTLVLRMPILLIILLHRQSIVDRLSQPIATRKTITAARQHSSALNTQMTIAANLSTAILTETLTTEGRMVK